ncbi:MAG TPA: HAMP domain-containing sensor histidine kinase, partial [Sunxiuqinia sp.]|nr:HAMP domain-containing sensor histidine kinase [Sunxiuqinia sp.]
YHDVAGSISVIDGELVITNPGEWNENEHGQIEINPTFIQVADLSGHVIKRSPNLMNTSMNLRLDEPKKVIWNTKLSTGEVRQLQMILTDEHQKPVGYVSVAIPFAESKMVLHNLLLVLFLAFPVVVLVLYFVTRYMAQRSLHPVKVLTETAEKITRQNLNERIELPKIKDELYVLTSTINNLLDRIEDTLMREKQFSSDASHELRTPLSVLKGTLELMVRKPREPEYFLEKSATCLDEVNRMSVLVDQLLLLARYENSSEPGKRSNVDLSELADQLIVHHAISLEKKEITLDLKIGKDSNIYSNRFMLEQILENIFANAVKYSHQNSTIAIQLSTNEQRKSLTIRDDGVGMNQQEIAGIFNRFYRADKSRNSQIKGFGLGLAIAKRFADQLEIQIDVESKVDKGTEFTLIFPWESNPSMK